MAISVQLTELGEVPPLAWDQFALLHSPHHVEHTRFLLAWEDGDVVGAAELYVPEGVASVHLVAVEVLIPHRGVCKKLVHALFDYGDQANRDVTVGGYTESGLNHLRRVLVREAAQHVSRFHEIPNI